jgi:CHAT domain-containing protein
MLECASGKKIVLVYSWDRKMTKSSLPVKSLAITFLALIPLVGVPPSVIAQSPITITPLSNTPNQRLTIDKSSLTSDRFVQKKNYWSEKIPVIEENWQGQYETYFKRAFPSLSMTAAQMSEMLAQLSQQTGKKTAVLWMVSEPEYLSLFLITPDNPPIGTRVPGATQELLSKTISKFLDQIVEPQSESYLSTAQQLYQWTIAPIEYHLLARKIDTIVLCVGEGLRSLPFAALHDGRHFLVEKYTLARIPGFNITSWSPSTLNDAEVLAMGASTFSDNAALPGVALELSAITPYPWAGIAILNQGFTIANLQAERQKKPFKIVHLATHTRFLPGDAENSYIQFSDSRLRLTQMKELGWNRPQVDLLVISACDTALGDKEAELGFAGLAIQSGAKSAIGSYWQVSDAGTLALMSEFYWHLKSTPLKGEALREAQIAMIKGKVHLSQGNLQSERGNIPLNPELTHLDALDFSHPYYWAGFSLIGNPF